MKYTKIFRILTLAIILSLLAIAIPANPAHAIVYYEEIYVYPYSGEIDDWISVDGEDFEPTVTEPVYAYIYFSSDEAEPGDRIGYQVTTYKKVKTILVDEDGTFSDARFKVPSTVDTESVRGGTYYIYATYHDSTRIVACDDFTVMAAVIELYPEEGVVGDEVEISGEDFAEREDITVEYDDDELEDDYLFECEDEGTDSRGDFDCAILIPDSTAGEHTITVSDETGSEAEATFTVEPEITISTTLGEPGDTVEVTGTGFAGRADIDITFDDDDVATDETDRDGSFTASFDVPDVVAGSYDVYVEDDDGNEGEVEFTVEIVIVTSVSVSPVTSQASPGHVGMDITVSGTDFIANHEITITYATEPIVVKTTNSDADGAFTATFKVPQSESGEHIITASDGTNTMSVTFIMESEAPPIPAPLLPEMGVEAESPVHFDWEDVTDDSLPVTYTLQIATDEDFTAASIVLEKEGLTDSGYTITEGEKLEPTEEEAPYYWRVKAIDGASNESGWSTPGSFYIAVVVEEVAGFAWPGWIIHLWWGLGAVAAIFFGFWLGKRRAYSY